MRTILFITAVAAIGYAVWLNNKEMKDAGGDIAPGPLPGDMPMRRGCAPLPPQKQMSQEVIPDSWVRHYDAGPFGTTVKVTNRVKMADPCCMSDFTSYDQDYIFEH